MNNKVITVIVILVLVVGGFLIFKNKSVAPTEDELNTNETVGDNEVAETPVVKDFAIEASSFKFTPATMTVNLGDTVRISLRNATGTHDLKIDEFNVATGVLNAGELKTITFVANKLGDFEYYCSVGTHRAMGMVGTLTVR